MESITPQNIEFYFLSFIRVLTLVNVLPVIGYEGINIRIRILFSFFLSAVTFPYAIYDINMFTGNIVTFFFYTLNEVAIGLIIGVIPIFIFYAFQFAGEFMSLQMGISMSQTIDPTLNSSMTTMGRLEYIFVMMIFFIINGHIFFIEAIVKSFEVIPLAGASFLHFGDILGIVGKNVTNLVEVGIKAGLPVIISLFVVEAALGIMARTVPQMNIFIVGIPLKIYVGLSLFALILGFTIRFFTVGFIGIENDVLYIINLLGNK